MKITFADKFIAILALLSGLTLSAVAIWYSVAGLVAIFAAAAIPIIVMGVVLEISKLVATVWLKINWQRAPIFIRTYLIIAIAVLMLITSMGIFGFLSKAHSDNSLVSGDVQSKIAVYDERIKTEKENIEAARKALSQMDAAVDQTMARSTNEAGAGRAAQLRRQQAKERSQLQKDIADSQKRISVLNDERAPIAAEVRKVEAEVGPIKYIAAFVYGDNPDANLLEKAVTWVIIIIVVVFDPLAVILLLASQYSFQWFSRAREEETDYLEKHLREVADDLNKVFADELNEEPKTTSEPFYPTASALWPFPASQYVKDPAPPTPVEVPPVQEEIIPEVEKKDLESQEELDREAEYKKKEQDETFQLNKNEWKEAHPDQTLKHYKHLYVKGLIDSLPWEQRTTTDNYNNEGYQQNAEQSEKTLFNKLSKK
jgi:hypothetical protein